LGRIGALQRVALTLRGRGGCRPPMRCFPALRAAVASVVALAQAWSAASCCAFWCDTTFRVLEIGLDPGPGSSRESASLRGGRASARWSASRLRSWSRRAAGSGRRSSTGSAPRSLSTSRRRGAGARRRVWCAPCTCARRRPPRHRATTPQRRRAGPRPCGVIGPRPCMHRSIAASAHVAPAVVATRQTRLSAPWRRVTQGRESGPTLTVLLLDLGGGTLLSSVLVLAATARVVGAVHGLSASRPPWCAWRARRGRAD